MFPLDSRTLERAERNSINLQVVRCREGIPSIREQEEEPVLKD